MGGGGTGGTLDRQVERPSPRLLALVLVLLSAGVVAATYLHPDPARNDFERFDDLRLSFLFFALFAGLSTVYGAVYRQQPRLSLRFVASIAMVLAVVMLASFPVGSRDVFGYAFFGRMLGTYGANPFLVSPAEFPADPWLPFTTRLMTRPVGAYGPLFLLQAWLVDAVGGDSLWLAVWLHKALAAGLALVCACVVVRILRRQTPPAASIAWVVALLAWNPLLWFEAAGAAHNDVAMALLVLLVVWCRAEGRNYSALAFLALSFWYKWYSLVFLPPLLIDRCRGAGLATALRDALYFSATTAVLGVVLFRPFPDAAASVLSGLFDPEKFRGIFPNELSPPLAGLFWSLRAAGLFDSDLGMRLFDLARYGLFAAAVILICLRQWRARPSLEAVIEACCLLGLAFLLLLITQLWPWHLLAVIALAVATGREPFLGLAVLLTILGLLSYLLTFAVASAMLVAIGATLWLMRRSQAGAH